MTCTVSITVSTETAAKLIANAAIGMFPDASVTMQAGEGDVESYIRRPVGQGLCVCGETSDQHSGAGVCLKVNCPCNRFRPVDGVGARR